MRRAFLGLFFVSVARADTVYLKNGNQMEGAVVSQSASELTLNIGYGTVSLKRRDIRKIVRSKASGDEIARREFESGRRVPEGAESLQELAQKARMYRQKALEAKAGSDAPEEEGLAARQEFLAMRDKYYSLYRSFREELDGEAALAMEKKAGGWQKDYFAWLRAEASRMEGDFQQDMVSSADHGNHLIVHAILNGNVPAKMLVDTGASVSILYPSGSAKLGAQTQVGESQIVVGDGRTMSVKLVRLESITVGKSVVRDAVVALVPSPGPGIDGLLGMSFLKNFVVRVDSANGTVILESLK